MSHSEAESSIHPNQRTQRLRYRSDGIMCDDNDVMMSDEMQMIEKSDPEYEEDPYVASDEENYIPLANAGTGEASDIEEEMVIEQEEEYDSDESVEDESGFQNVASIWIAKDGTEWVSNPSPRAQKKLRNILREKGGPTTISNLFSRPKELFKLIISPEIYDIILQETNRNGKTVCDTFNNHIVKNFSKASEWPPLKAFEPFTEAELNAFIGILIAAGIHGGNKESLDDMWKIDGLPLIRAAMSRDRFKMMLRFIRFDNGSTRAEREQTDKAAPIRDIWTMMNRNLERAYMPYKCITVHEQLFPYRGHTKFTQYMPSKPAKYGIKVFWACDAINAYPLHGQLYTGKPPDGPQQVNVGERIVLELTSLYKGSGRNVTTDDFFTTMGLAKVLNTWNMTLVGTVRKNKSFLPSNMQPAKERPVYSTNFAYNRDAMVCSYVPKKNKSVVLLSSLHMKGEVKATHAGKPEIIKYYNKTKSGVNTMDKRLGEYTVKRRTLRWPLAFFYNMIDIAGLASHIIYKEHNPGFRTNDQRRRFMKDLAAELCMPSIEARSTNPVVMRSNFRRGAVQMMLGGIVTSPQVAASHAEPRGGRTPIVGSCHVCRHRNRKQRKTRKSCAACAQPVCNQHSVSRTTCIICESD